MILSGFHIIHPDPTQLSVPSLPPSDLVTTPTKKAKFKNKNKTKQPTSQTKKAKFKNKDKTKQTTSQTKILWGSCSVAQ